MVSLQFRLINFFLRRFLSSAFTVKSAVESRQRLLKGEVKALFRVKRVYETKLKWDNYHSLVFKQVHVQPKRVILYLHGGAFYAPMLFAHKKIIEILAVKNNALVVAPEYRLAPEHPFPAGLDDCYHAYQALIKEGWGPENIAVIGDSAGGNLALSLVMRLKDEGMLLPAAVSVISPVTNLNFDTAAFRENTLKDPIFNSDDFRCLLSEYITDEQQRDNPLVSPLLGDFSRFPPLQIQVSSTEILRDDGLLVAQKAMQAGVPVQFKMWDGLPHVHQAFWFLPEAQASFNLISEFFQLYVTQIDKPLKTNMNEASLSMV